MWISQEDLLVLGLCQPYHLVLLAQGDEPVSLVDFLGDYPNILEFVFAEAPGDADDRKSWGVLRGVQITADPPNMVQ